MSSTFDLQPADYFDTRPREHLILMRRLGQLGSEVLPGKVKLFMQIGPPFGTVGHIVNDSVVSDQLGGAALSGPAAKFHLGDDAIRDAHTGDYTGIEKRKIS